MGPMINSDSLDYTNLYIKKLRPIFYLVHVVSGVGILPSMSCIVEGVVEFKEEKTSII